MDGPPESAKPVALLMARFFCGRQQTSHRDGGLNGCKAAGADIKLHGLLSYSLLVYLFVRFLPQLVAQMIGFGI